MTRRTFLRILGSATVVATISTPSLPAPWPLPATNLLASSSALTWEMLEAAYAKLAVGAERPTLVVVSSTFARQYGLVYDVFIAEAA